MILQYRNEVATLPSRPYLGKNTLIFSKYQITTEKSKAICWLVERIKGQSPLV